MTRSICLMVLSLVPVGCSLPGIGTFDPAAKAAAEPPVVNVHVDMSPVADKLDALVAKLDARLAVPDTTPDAKPFVREEAKPEVVPEMPLDRTPMPRQPDPEPVPRREPSPAPPVETPFVPQDDRVERLAEAVDALRQTVADDIAARREERTVKQSLTVPKSDAQGYTGAVIWTVANCPPCELLKSHLRGAGWTVSDAQHPHFWIRPSQGQSGPTVTYFANGERIGEVVGYGGTQAELSAIVNRHPLVTSPRHVPALVQPVKSGDEWGPDPSPNCSQPAFGAKGR